METRRRTAVKAVLWNLIGLAVMVTVGVVLTGSFSLGGGIAVLNASLGLATYFVYERVWARVTWGRV